MSADKFKIRENAVIRTTIRLGRQAAILGAFVFASLASVQASAAPAPQPAPQPAAGTAQERVSASARFRSGECLLDRNWYMRKVDASIDMPFYPDRQSSSCWLKSGSGKKYGSKWAVRALQDNLRSCNGQDIAVDGEFGPQTRRALINVQKRHRLTRDGVYGPKTRSAMYWLDFERGKGCVKYHSNGYWWGE